MTASPMQMEERTGSSRAGAMVLGTVMGAVCAASVLPAWFSSWQGSIAGVTPQAYWFLSRSSGVVAYVAMTLSMALGLVTTNRLARVWPGGPLAVDLHEFLSLLGLALAGFHVFILLGDRWINYTLHQLLVPMTAEYRPTWVALGQIGFGLALPVALSFYVRGLIGYRAWRALHLTTFLVYVLITLHGMGAGTDADALRPLYGCSVLLTLFLTIYRVLTTAINTRSGASAALRSAVGDEGSEVNARVAVPPSAHWPRRRP